MPARDDNPKLHRIEVERDSDGDVESVRFVCDGSDDALCHRWPACGCETWGEGSHYADEYDPADPGKKRQPLPGHADVQQPTCWMAPWFNDTTSSPNEFAELYDGELAVDAYGSLDWLICGPVSTTFEGDYMTWEYADA